MQDIFIVYDTCCFFEIVILNYFMNVSGCEVVLCSLDKEAIRTMEGYSVNVDKALAEVDLNLARSFIIPGGNISIINNDNVKEIINELRKRKVLIAGICAGVDLLDDAGILINIKSTHSTKEDLINDDNVITARGNAYVDFAIEVSKQLNLFKDEADLQESIHFWKNNKNI